MISYVGPLKEQLLREIHIPLKILANKEVVGREGASSIIDSFFKCGSFLGNIYSNIFQVLEMRKKLRNTH